MKTETIEAYQRRGFSYWELEGQPGLGLRHTCVKCGRKRYENLMVLYGFVRSNNYKAWLLWKCKVCKRKEVKR